MQSLLITALTLLPVMVTAHLTLGVEDYHLAPSTVLCDPIPLSVFSFPNSVASIPIVTSSLQRRVIIELSRILGLPSKMHFSQLH